MNDLNLTVSTHTGPVPITILHVAGRLDANTEPSLQERVDQLRAGGTRHLVLDMAQVEYISSAGLRAIYLIYKLFTPADEVANWKPDGDVYKSPYFKLASLTPQVYSVFNMAGFLHNIPFFADLKEALDSFAK